MKRRTVLKFALAAHSSPPHAIPVASLDIEARPLDRKLICQTVSIRCGRFIVYARILTAISYVARAFTIMLSYWRNWHCRPSSRDLSGFASGYGLVANLCCGAPSCPDKRVWHLELVRHIVSHHAVIIPPHNKGDPRGQPSFTLYDLAIAIVPAHPAVDPASADDVKCPQEVYPGAWV